jgi:hypothetical protein
LLPSGTSSGVWCSAQSNNFLNSVEALAFPRSGKCRTRCIKFGVVQKASILGNTDERIRAAQDGSVDVSSANQVEESDLGRSALGLQFAEPEQGEPVRVWLSGHQLARALALAFDPAAAHEAAMIQEETQQLKIGRAQMAA